MRQQGRATEQATMRFFADAASLNQLPNCSKGLASVAAAPYAGTRQIFALRPVYCATGLTHCGANVCGVGGITSPPGNPDVEMPAAAWAAHSSAMLMAAADGRDGDTLPAGGMLQ